MKDELGWAEFMVRSDRAIRRHWTRLLRAVRAWLTPVCWLARCWQARSHKAPPPELGALMEFLLAGCGINLYLRL